jgi:hypothetical protein
MPCSKYEGVLDLSGLHFALYNLHGKMQLRLLFKLDEKVFDSKVAKFSDGELYCFA